MPPQGALPTPQRVPSTPQNMPPQGAPPTPQGADGSYELETVQTFLDNLVEEMHISDDEFNTDKDQVCVYKLACTLFISGYSNIATTTLHNYIYCIVHVRRSPLFRKSLYWANRTKVMA